MPGGVASTETPRPGVTIRRDARFSIPRITGVSRADVMWGSGYAQAQDRLFLMDVLRRTARGSLSELVGPSGAEGDAATLTQQDFSAEELEAQVASMSDRHGADGQAVEDDLKAFVEGINAWIEVVRRDTSRQPVEYAALGAPIAPVDHRGLRRVGDAPGQPVQPWPASGSARGPRSSPRCARRSAARRRPSRSSRTCAAAGSRGARSPATGKRFPYEPTLAKVGPDGPSPFPTRGRSSRATRWWRGAGPRHVPPFVGSLTGLGDAIPPRQSNAMLLSGRHSRSGHPLVSMGPQVGYFSPQIFSEVELRGGGIDVAGVVFPGAAPYVLIGRTPKLAWSGTSPMSDLGDTFVERLCRPDGRRIADPAQATHHLHRGRCVPFTVREQTLTTPASPTSPGSTSRTIKLKTLRSVHGPVTHFARVGGEPVALAQQKSVDFREIDAALAFSRLAAGQASDVPSFQQVWRDYPGAENWYVVNDREIGFVLSGTHPVRAKGADPGLPTWGTGEYDWQRFDPAAHTFRALPYSRTPRSREPAKGWIVNWNNKEAAGWRAPADVWTLGPTHRSLLLERRLRAEVKRGKLDLPQLVRVAQAAHMADLEVQELLPLFKRVMQGRTTPAARELLALLDAWRARGGEHRDPGRTGLYEDGAALALMRAWMPLVARRVFEPRLGSEVVDVLDETGLIALQPGRSEFGGWHGHLNKDLRRVLGRKVRGPLSRRYCGGGSRARCARILVATLEDAAAKLRADFGGGPERWRAPVQNTPITTAGAIDTPTFPVQNRGTFHQVLELSRRP
jgi:acyl-homoserine lactone acylase PvdQ